jgi:hypothetical protein
MVDDTLTKFKYSPRNVLLVPPFMVTEPATDPYSDTTLEGLANYFEALHLAGPTDVRTYLETHPFSSQRGAHPI